MFVIGEILEANMDTDCFDDNGKMRVVKLDSIRLIIF